MSYYTRHKPKGISKNPLSIERESERFSEICTNSPTDAFLNMQCGAENDDKIKIK